MQNKVNTIKRNRCWEDRALPLNKTRLSLVTTEGQGRAAAASGGQGGRTPGGAALGRSQEDGTRPRGVGDGARPEAGKTARVRVAGEAARVRAEE